MERQLVAKTGTSEAKTNDHRPFSFSHEPRFPIRGILHSGKNLSNQPKLYPAKLQTKLAVSQPGDSYEQETDQVNEMPSSSISSIDFSKIPIFPGQVQRKCSNFCATYKGFSSPGFHSKRILQSQITADNKTVQRLIKSGALQAKLKISQPNDIYEQEADRVAEQVMRMPDPVVQSQPLQVTPVIHRQVAEEEALQSKEAADQSPTITTHIESRINELQSGGQPLDPAMRAFFEPRFGHDLSGVRVHTDAKAADVAREVNARAFTVGRDVVFGAGQFEMGTSYRNHLLAHELVHSIQQGQNLTLIQRIFPGQQPLPKKLFSDSSKSSEPSEPEPEPAQQHALYEQKLIEGANLLKDVKFGRAEAKLPYIDDYCDYVGLSELTLSCCDNFDEDYWERKIDEPRYERKLVLKPGKYPSMAVDALFDPKKKSRWKLDCAQFNQVVHWYALRHAYGATKFNKIIGKDFELRVQNSSGIKIKERYLRESPFAPMRRYSDGQVEPISVDDLLAAAPIGSRIAWTNLAAKPTAAYRNENTFKTGPDKFYGHPIAKKYGEVSQKKLEQILAKYENTNADDKYIQENIFISEIEYYDSP